MMLLVVVVGMFLKWIIMCLIMWYGYCKVLFVNMIMVGVMMVSFVLMCDMVLVWVKVVYFVLFGGFNLMQFIVMNMLMLKDFGIGGVSSGNSLFLFVQMLLMSFGVMVVGVLFVMFIGMLCIVMLSNMLLVFYVMFVCVGIIMVVFVWIFVQFVFEICSIVCKIDLFECV